jgi:hypothetical protein
MKKLLSLLLAMVSIPLGACTDHEEVYQAATWPAEVQDAVLVKIKELCPQCKLLAYISQYDYNQTANKGRVRMTPPPSVQEKQKRTYYALLMAPKPCDLKGHFINRKVPPTSLSKVNEFARNMKVLSSDVSLWEVDGSMGYKKAGERSYYYISKYTLENYCLLFVKICPKGHYKVDPSAPNREDLWQWVEGEDASNTP